MSGGDKIRGKENFFFFPHFSATNIDLCEMNTPERLLCKYWKSQSSSNEGHRGELTQAAQVGNRPQNRQSRRMSRDC